MWRFSKQPRGKGAGLALSKSEKAPITQEAYLGFRQHPKERDRTGEKGKGLRVDSERRADLSELKAVS